MSFHFKARWWANKLARAIASGIYRFLNWATHTTCEVPGCKRKVYRWRNRCATHKHLV